MYPNRTFRTGFFLLIFIFTCIRIYLALQVPATGVYNIDERISVHSGMLLLVNSTPICLEWPGGPLLIGIAIVSFLELFVTTPFLSALMSVNVLGASQELTSFIATHINNPSFYIDIRLLMQLAFLTLIPFLMMQKRIFALNGRWLLLAGVLCSPILLTTGMIIHPDSLAILFWIFLLVHLIYDKYKLGSSFMIIAGAYAGILLSIKLTYFIAFPFITVYLLYYWTTNHSFAAAIRKLIVFYGVALVIFAALCPFLFTNTLTVIKAFAGQLITKTASGDDSINQLLTQYIPSLVVWPLLILSLIGLMWGVARNFTAEKALLIVLFFVFCLPFIKTSATYSRYCFPLIPIILFWAVDGWNWISETVKHKSVTLSRVLIIAAFLLSGLHLYIVNQKWQKDHFACSNLDLLKNYVNDEISPGSSIAMHEDLMHLVPEDKNSLERLLALNSAPDRVMKKLKVNEDAIKMVQQGKSSGYFIANEVFADHAAYTQKLYAIQLDYLHSGQGTGKYYNVYYYSDLSYAANTSLTLDELNSYKDVEYFVSEKPLTNKGTLVKHFDNSCSQEIFIYRAEIPVFQQAPAGP